MKEQWKDIEGFDGFYQISNLGRVKSAGGWCGHARKQPAIRAVSHTHDGYLKVRLVYKGRDRTARIHRLVAEAFIPNPDNKETVNHKDGNKENNHIDNLEWANRHEQLQHAYDHNLKKPMRGNKNPNAKLTDDQVREIRRTYIPRKKGCSTVALGNIYGVTDRVIGLIVSGKSYKNVK